jgi:hypothetical protein
MLEVLGTLGTIVLFLWVFATTPQRTSCPPHWWIPEGVRTTGAFVCKRSPVGDDHRDANGILHDDSVQPDGTLDGHVWCEAPSRPVIATDGRTVLCR